jgi:hypothetical protein
MLEEPGVVVGPALPRLTIQELMIGGIMRVTIGLPVAIVSWVACLLVGVWVGQNVGQPERSEAPPTADELQKFSVSDLFKMSDRFRIPRLVGRPPRIMGRRVAKDQPLPSPAVYTVFDGETDRVVRVVLSSTDLIEEGHP